jgi:phosphomannomutase/phosphoglucomutase
VTPNIFREYDIRGLAATELTDGVVRAIGRAYASRVAEEGGRRVAVGMDVRESSPRLAVALIEGITRAGLDVVRLGVVPTPAVYFSVHHLGLDGAVQVTGSHNPIEFNGFKLVLGKASLYGEAIQDLRRRIEAGEFRIGRGTVQTVNLREDYLQALASRLAPARPLKLVLDAGNGCAGELAPELFRRLGTEVECLFCDPDGRFPNHIPDPTLPKTLVTLRERVLATGADLGLAYDGDADRLGALDERGQVVWGDRLLALFAREVLAHRPGAPILFEVKCSRALVEDIEAHGGKPVMTRTGHSLIKQAMRETGSPLAGEMSGHMFFADEWYGFDDAIYASGRLVRLVAASDRPLSELLAAIPQYHATPEIRIDCPDDRKFDVVEAVRARYRTTHDVVEVDGARVSFDGGWGLVRASNTQPVLVLRAEGTTPESRDAIEGELRRALAALGVEGAERR